MVTTRPDCELQGRYSQKQAAELLGVERHTIKRWENEGYISFFIRKVGRSRYTTGRQIIKCWSAAY